MPGVRDGDDVIFRCPHRALRKNVDTVSTDDHGRKT
jgi:hypothetical protein